jgi:hypothetical protein
MNNAPLPQQNSGFSGLSARKPRWDDKVPYYDIPKDGQWYRYRFFGPLFMTAAHWLETKSGKRFPLLCTNYDSKTQHFSGSGCKIEEEFDPKNSPIKKIKDMQARQSGLMHAIPRALQKQGSNDPAWRPWRPVRIPMTVIMAIKQLTGLNTHNINGTEYKADVADPYYGQDINIMYDPNGQNPNQKYTVALGGHTPLTDVEMSYLKEIFRWEEMIQYPTVDEVKQSLQINGYYQLLNGGPQVQVPGVADQVLAGVPQPPAYQMASINPGVTSAPPVPQPAGLAPAYPGQAYQPAPAQYQAAPYQQPVAPAPAPSYYPPQPSAPIPQAAPAPAAPLPQVTPGFNVQSAPEAVVQAPVYQAPAPTPAPVVSAPQPTFQQPMAAPQPTLVQQPVATPVVSAPPQVVAPAPVAQAAPVAMVPNNVVSIGTAASTEKRFGFPGKPNGLSASELQAVVTDFSQTLQSATNRALPLKVWDRDDMAGMQVVNCFGAYKGDPSCIRCPLRRYCLTY